MPSDDDGGSTTTASSKRKKVGNPAVREQFDVILDDDDDGNQKQRNYRCRHCKTLTFKWAKFNSAKANIHLSKCRMVPADVRESCLGGTQAAKKAKRLLEHPPSTAQQQALTAHAGSVASPESSAANQWDTRIGAAEANWDMPTAAGTNRRERIEALEMEVLGMVSRGKTFEERLRALE
jgi:hypothetical protein